MAVVEVAHLRKVYDGRSVVNDVSFTVSEGEIFGILGPNGVGKTTTVECIEGLRQPDGGDVSVLGLDPRRDGARLRRVLGAQLQESQLQARLRVWEALDLYSSFYDDPLGVEELLEMLGLGEQRDIVFGRLSGGCRAARSSACRGVRARVLVLTTYDTDGLVLAAIDAGATGYLLKDAPRDELFRAVRAAARGEAVLAPSVATQLVGRVRDPQTDALTPRELEILRLVAGGASHQQAAERLFISEATVKTHLLHTYQKLGVNDRAAAVAAAYDRGLLTPTGRGPW